MLVHLSVRDFAIIDASDLDFRRGMTALTGETGAGKSLLVDALSLLLGARATADAIRTGCDEAEVAGQFALGGTVGRRVHAKLKELGLPPCDDDALILRRVLSRAGRHRQFINGTLATVSQLKEIGAPLVDFTGQHAAQHLTRAGAQLDLVDALGGHEDDRRAFAEAHKEVAERIAERDRLLGGSDDQDRQAEFLRFQLDEIDRVDPQPGEEDELLTERNRLKHGEQLRKAVGSAQLTIADDDGSALERLQAAAHELAAAGAHDDTLARLAGTLEEAAALVDDVARTLARHDDFDADPARLDEIEERLDAVRTVCRKHGGTIEAVRARRDEMEEELHAIEHGAERLAELDQEIAAHLRALSAKAETLSGKRRAAARKLSKQVARELGDLGMAGAAFEVAVEPLAPSGAMVVGSGEHKRGLNATGGDRVEFRLRANVGEDAHPLAKVASGGELSRVLLAVKRVLLAKDPVPVSVFDEVDAGVGGAVGEVIGEKLRSIAEGRQVLCVTHLGQIAAQAHTHLRVEKAADDGRTVSRLTVLQAAEREEELARMLGGKKITEATRQHAREMLANTAPSAIGQGASDTAGAASSSSPAAQKAKSAESADARKAPKKKASAKKASAKKASKSGRSGVRS